MGNIEGNENEMGSNETGVLARDKQPLGTIKKAALRDVQNEKVGCVQKQQECLLSGGGKPSRDTSKVNGNKRLTPEQPSSSQGLSYIAYNGTNENVMNARRRFELELGRGKLQKNVEIYLDGSQSRSNSQLPQEIPQKASQTMDCNPHHVPVVTSNDKTPIVTFSSSGPTVKNSIGEHNTNTQNAKTSPEPSLTVDVESTNDQLRAERFIRLHKFLKQCEDCNKKDYTKILMHLSTAELSKHAVELEKRAIQLTMEEGNEMQRMKLLIFWGNTLPTTIWYIHLVICFRRIYKCQCSRMK